VTAEDPIPNCVPRSSPLAVAVSIAPAATRTPSLSPLQVLATASPSHEIDTLCFYFAPVLFDSWMLLDPRLVPF
jgi:hypothetical protein